MIKDRSLSSKLFDFLLFVMCAVVVSQDRLEQSDTVFQEHYFR